MSENMTPFLTWAALGSLCHLLTTFFNAVITHWAIGSGYFYCHRLSCNDYC